MPPTYELFISYSQQDGDIAASLASRLEEAGLKCFMADRSILAAAQWQPTLRNAIVAARSLLLLVTPRSKDSLWVAAEAGAAWVLEKPVIPVLMFVEPHQLFEPIRQFQARRAETPEQIAALVSELRALRPVGAPAVRVNPAEGERTEGSGRETFTASMWDRLLKVGEWTTDARTGTILGEGTHRYLLSHSIYGPESFTIRCRLTFLELFPKGPIDAVNAGIVLGWTVPNNARRYHHVMFTGERLLLERIGSHGRDEYSDFDHIDEGVPFQLQRNCPYDLVIDVDRTAIRVRCNGNEVYSPSLPEPVPAGRVGLRPWRSRMECKYFEVSEDSSNRAG
jgi:hypothetical protein